MNATTQNRTRAICGWRVGLWLALAFIVALMAEPVNAASRSIQSVTRQFFASATAEGMPRATAPIPASTNLISLDPGSLAILAERVKESLLRELGAQDRWSGKIFFILHPATPGTTPVFVQNIRFTDAWQYQVDLHDRLDADQLTRAVVQALLQEMANRHAGPRAAELPAWLVEGLTAQVLMGGGPTLVPQPRTRQTYESIAPDAFQTARAVLMKHSPYSFSDLSLPSAQQVSGEGWPVYQASAQVFVAQLLALPEGRAQLREFIARLPRYWNSQLAFIESHRTQFGTMLDVEKWWSLATLNFGNRDRFAKWSHDASLARLDEILQLPMEVQPVATAPAELARLRLQEVLEKAEYPAQKALLQRTASQIQLLQLNSPPDLARLMNDYRVTILGYLRQRDSAGIEGPRGQLAPSSVAAVNEARKQLDVLDVILGDFRKYAPASAKIVAPGAVNTPVPAP